MDNVQKWAQAGILGVALVTGQVGWTYEPPQPPIPPAPDRVVVTRGSGSFLGIGVQEIDSDRAKALNLREEHGVEVTRLEDDSPAAKGGIKVGDVVLQYNGERVEGVEQFMRMVRETPPGREVKLSIARNGAPQQLSMKTGSRKTWMTARYGESVDFPRIEIPEINVPDVPRAFMSWRSSIVGIEAESLDSQLAEYFGVKEGVLVRSVVRGSAAEKSGLRAGDVIVKIDDSPVTSPREISASIRSKRGKKTVPVQIIRDKREVTIQLAVEDQASEMYHAMPKRTEK
jgi:serine protease Do